MRTPFVAVALAVALTVSACSTTDSSTDTPSSAPTAASSTQAPVPFVVTSTDFVDQGQLPETVKATAFGGQCEGENISPELTWTGAPEGTVSFAITMIDLSSSDFVHWQKVNIPASVTSVGTGEADSLEGISGINGNGTFEYFGPCPPSGEHTYLFTVYALDTMVDLQEGFTIGFARLAFEDHVLGQTTIAGLASPAN